jgi:hypothetical protein
MSAPEIRGMARQGLRNSPKGVESDVDSKVSA